MTMGTKRVDKVILGCINQEPYREWTIPELEKKVGQEGLNINRVMDRMTHLIRGGYINRPIRGVYCHPDLKEFKRVAHKSYRGDLYV